MFNSIWFRKIVNPAQFFLLVLIGLTIWNCSLQIEQLKVEKPKENKEVWVRVISSQRDNFGQVTYNVWIEGGVWEVQSKEYLDIGKVYLVRGEVRYYTLLEGSKNIYDLSLGISGFVKNSKIILIQTSCDLVCYGIKTLANTQKYLKKYYFNTICQDLKIIPQWISANSNCQDVYALSVGLVLGGTSDFTKSTKTNFKNLGLSHLVAVSGFQVALVISFIEEFLSKLRIGKVLRLTSGLLAVMILILLVGPQPPVLRSAVSISISSILLTLFGRKISSFRSLIYSGIILLIINPLYLISISFQLSFLASLGLVMTSELGVKTSDHIWKEFYTSLVTTISTFVFTLPVIVNISGFTSPFSIATNLIITPFIPIVTFFNLLSIIPIVGEIFLIPATIIQSLMIFLVNDIGPNVQKVSLSSFSFLEAVLYYITLIILIQVLVFVKNIQTEKSI